jgi:hypothetical protein
MFRGKPEPKEPSPLWDKFAALIEGRVVIPSRYVRWAYMQLRPTHNAVWIPQITSEKMLASFLNESFDAITKETLKLRLQLDTLKRQLESGRSVREVLEDELLDLCDAIRYAVARKSGMTDIAERWRRGADLDIENEPVYAKMLSGFLE